MGACDNIDILVVGGAKKKDIGYQTKRTDERNEGKYEIGSIEDS